MDNYTYASIQEELYKKEFGDDYKCLLVGDDYKLDAIVWYHKPYGLSLPSKLLHKKADRKNHDLVINYLNRNKEKRELYLDKKLYYYDILKLAEDELDL